MAMADFSNAMDQEIQRQIEEISKLPPGSVGSQRALDSLAKLYKERTAHYVADLTDDNTRQSAEDARAKEAHDYEIESEKLKVEREKIEIEKSKIENESRKLDIEEDKNAVAREQIEIEKSRVDLDTQRLAFDRRDAAVKTVTEIGSTLLHIAVEVAGIVLPLRFYHEWMLQGLHFERNGSFRSSTFKGLCAKFKPTRK